MSKRTTEEMLNSARIRDHINHSLRKYYQACLTDELPPRLRATVKKLDEERPESGEHVEVTGERKE